MNKEDVIKEAKEIMDDFIDKLREVEEPEEFGYKRKDNKRLAEVKPWDKEFQGKMLKNAPKTRDNSIVGEKKDW